jgi:hypothetical protein
MTALANKKSTVEEFKAKLREQGEVDRQTIAGPELNFRLSLSPRMILLAVSPVSIALTMFIGWVILKSIGQPLYGHEMLAAALINVVGGTLAALPLFFKMKYGTVAIAQAGLMGIVVRCSTILGGLLLAFGPGWGLDKMPVVYWVLAFYFPLLIAETFMVAWLSQRARY